MDTLSVMLEWSSLAVATTAVLGVFGIVAILVRLLVLYLKSELIAPTLETNRQITGTTTVEPESGPTFREQLEEKLAQVHERVDSVSGEVTDAAAELAAMALMFDGHIEWSQEDHDAIRRERQQIVDELWAELGRQREAGETPETRHGRHRAGDDEG